MSDDIHAIDACQHALNDSAQAHDSFSNALGHFIDNIFSSPNHHDGTFGDVWNTGWDAHIAGHHADTICNMGQDVIDSHNPHSWW